MENKKFKIEYCVYLIALAIGICVLLCLYRPIRRIDLKGVRQNEAIIFDELKCQLEGDSYVLEGICYDPANRTVYDNWITGKGENVLLDHCIILSNGEECLKLPTAIRYLFFVGDKHDNFRFMVRIPAKYGDYLVGALSKDQKGNESYKLENRRVKDYVE